MPASQASVEAVSGSTGAVLALLVTYPLKTIYTLQAISAAKAGVKSHDGLADVLDIIAKYRLEGLFVGIGPNIVETAASNGVYFYIYSWLKQKAQVHTAQHRAEKVRQKHSTNVTAGSYADVAAGRVAPSAKATTAGPAHATATPVYASSSNNGGTTTSQTSASAVRLGVLSSLVVAAVAGMLNQLMTMPIGTVSTRIVANQKRRVEAATHAAAERVPVGTWPVIREILAEGGLPAFWNGLLPAMVLVANPAIQYMLYEQLLQILQHWKLARQQRSKHAQQDTIINSSLPSVREEVSTTKAPPAVVATPASQLSAGEYFLASALAKIGATVATFPLIVIKSRLQAAGRDTAAELRYNGAFDAVTRIFTVEGPSGFFRGLRAKVLQTALNAALMLMLKEKLAAVIRRAMDSPISINDVVKQAIVNV